MWTAVPGAVSYDVQLDEADGDSNVFNIKSPAGTFTKLTGIGTFKFRVRANFAALQATRAGAGLTAAQIAQLNRVAVGIGCAAITDPTRSRLVLPVKP